MNKVENSYPYNKFVVRDIIDFDEVDMFVEAYLHEGVQVDAVYCMPEGATFEQQELTEKDVAEACMQTGYKFSPDCILIYLAMLGVLNGLKRV